MQPAKLTTFVPPRSSPKTLRLMETLNRRLLLSGVPGLRDIPGFGSWPLVSGVAKVRHLDFLEEEEAHLRSLLAPGNVTFVAANHPEFFTDWVIDREIAARYAPEMAIWVPPQLVNGHFQKLWLRNNFIPSLTGPDANPAKVHSLDWALQGKSVLIHPESMSGWHGHEISPIYPSVAELAVRAQLTLERKKLDKAACIVPLVWKLRFMRDEDDALHKEVAYVEHKLHLRGSDSEKLETRVYGVTEQLLEREEVRCGVLPLYKKTFVQRWEYLYALCLKQVFGLEYTKYSTLNPEIALRHAQKKLTQEPQAGTPWLQTMSWLARFSPHFYTGPNITQEQLAEILKRVRQDHCEGAWVDRFNQVLPSPAGPRIAYFSVAPVINVAEFRKAHPTLNPEKTREELTKILRIKLQTALNALNQRVTEKTGYVVYPNPYQR